MEEKRSFAYRKTIGTEVPLGYGIVINANGEVRQPDRCIPEYLDGRPSERSWIEVWDEIASDEAALSWEWCHNHYHFVTAFTPEAATPQMVTTAQRLYQEILGFHSAEINWGDWDCWRFNPTGAPGWRLGANKPMPTDDEMRALIEAANRRLANVPNLWHERPSAALSYTEEDGWTLSIGDAFGQCNIAPLLPSSVEHFLQLEHDYLCHYAVVKQRQEQRTEYAEKYECRRATIEGHGGCLIDVGADGFCIISNGVAEVYGLNDEDYSVFTQYCEELKPSTTEPQDVK